MFRKLIFIFFCFQTILFCNNVVDEELWYSVEINKKITDNLELELEKQFRLNDHYSTQYKTLNEASISYQIIQILELSVKYRYVFEIDKTEERISLGTKFSMSDKWYFPKYKIKLQKDYDENKLPQDFVLRNKISFDLPPILSLNPSIYFESYHTKESNNFIYDKFRISPSIEFNITTRSSLELFFIYKGEIKDDKIEVSQVIGTKYEFSF